MTVWKGLDISTFTMMLYQIINEVKVSLRKLRLDLNITASNKNEYLFHIWWT